MGEYAEMAMDQEMFNQFERELKLFFKPDYTTWKCKDGRVMKLTEMTDSHIGNTIRMLQAKNPINFATRIYYLNEELKKRKEQPCA